MPTGPPHLARRQTVPWVLLLLLVAGGCERSSWQPPLRWERANPRLVTPVHDLLRDPTDPTVIYAACGWQSVDSAQHYGGVLRSDDRGVRWSESNVGLPRKAEVLTLAAVPHRFLAAEIRGEGIAEAPALLAGTRKSGLHVSVDGGRSWSGFPEDPGALRWDQLTLQTVVALPGAPRALALGSKEHGVLLSEDGGLRWKIRNTGLQNPSVQRLVLAPDGSLLAATWYGGIYRTEDRGLRWESLSSDYERASVSTLALSGDGVLWLGLQNGGLLAAPFSGSSPLSFEPQGPEVIGGAGILALAMPEIRESSGFQRRRGVSGGLAGRFAGPPGVVVGTSGRGAAFGHLGGQFATVTEGLENSTVSAVLLAADDPDDILIGTWSGLYRGVPPPSRTPGLVAAMGLLVAVGVVAWIAWSRSATAAGRKLLRGLLFQEQEQAALWWDRRIAELPPDRAPAILYQFTRQLRRSRFTVGVESAFFLGTANLCEALHQIEGRTDRDSRHRIADVLEKRASDFGRLADKLESLGQHLHAVTIGRHAAQQDTLYAQLLRAESLGHLTALRQRHSEAVFDATDPNTGQALGDLLETIEQLGRISGSEDRALYLGQALSRAFESVEKRKAEFRPSERRKIGIYVLEAVRDLLVNELRNIHQCAELRVTLHSKLLTTQREAVVVLEVENVGQGPAQNVAVELQRDEGFRALRRRRELKSLMRGQSARLEFLVEPQVSDRVRLRFHISFDDLERHGQRREFADMVEFRKLGEHRTFTPLRPNPYVVGRPLVESDIFMGREDTFELLESSLRGAQQDNVVVLMGPRRMGKTSILRRLSDHLGRDYVPVLVDLQGMIGSGETAFFRELTAVIHDELEEAGIEVPEPPAEAFADDPGGAFRRKFLKSIRRTLGERRLLLLFDEFEVLEGRIRSGDLEPRILPYFRSLMQHERSISFVFAGTHRLDELTRDYWGVLFNLAIYLEVGHLSRSEVEQLFVEPTRAFFEIDPLALDKAFQLTGGHPHFSQLLARELIEFRNQRKLSYITIQDLNEVADRVTEKGQLHISYLWEDGSRTEQLFLLALKERLERTGMATLNAVQNSLDQYPTETNDPAVALRQLVRREILVDNAGLLSFRIELLKLWLDRNLDAESFVLSEPHPPGS